MRAGGGLLVGVPFLTFCIGLHGQSVDPLNQWQIITDLPSSIRGLAYKDGTFVAAGANTNIIVSTNGTNWFLVPSAYTNWSAVHLAAAAGAGQFVVVGAGFIQSSPDGFQWTIRQVQTGEEYWAVTYGGGQFVVVGFGPSNAVALTSADGVQWERFVLPFNATPRNIAYGNGVYVAASVFASMYSTNGRDWTPLNSVLYQQGVAYGGGKFITTGGSPGYISSNGLDWTEISLPTLGWAYNSYYTAAYANGTFVIGGFCESCPNANRPSLVATSTNGTQWTSQLFGADTNIGPIRDIVFVDGSFYLGDQWGKIWKSGRMAPAARPIITQAVRNGGQINLSFTALPGFRYAAERADYVNSIAWTPWLGPLFATTEQISVSDPDTTNAARFYRIRME